jgi:hypothetical protein
LPERRRIVWSAPREARGNGKRSPPLAPRLPTGSALASLSEMPSRSSPKSPAE